MGMNKNFIGLFIASGLAVNVNLYGQPQEESLPNIVFVLADDMGIGDLGCYGQTKIKTPNIDKLSNDGMVFTTAYSSAANSAPSRACFMSGMYTPRHGIFTVSPPDRGTRLNES